MSAHPAVTAPGWASLIEAMLDAVWLVDARSLAIVAANQAAGRLMAMAPHELHGKTMIELAFTPEDLVFWGEAGQGQAEQIESETMVTRTDGRVVAVRRRVSRVDVDGAPLFI
ncbi:MAG: PAS domain-containing protein, partial [Rhizobacter sp.]